MKRLILFELIILFLATTFESDSPPGWFQQTIALGNKTITDIQFIDSSNGWTITNWGPTFDTAYIFITSTGGTNWNVQYRYPVSFTAISMVDINTGYASGGTGFGRLFKTTNSGTNWNLIYTAGSLFNDLFFVNKDTGWVCDDDIAFGAGLLKTTNGGVSWVQQLNNTYRPIKLFFINKDTGWVGTSDANGRLFRTINGGTNWSLQYTTNIQINSIFFLNGLKGWIRAGGGNGTAYTLDGGFNWIFAQGEFAGRDLKFVNDSIGFSGNIDSKISKTVNGGKNWGYQNSPIFNNLSVFMIKNDTINGWGGGNGFVKSTDGGGIIIYTGIHQINTEIPTEFKLHQNYPNPFNPITNIIYELKVKKFVKLKVFDVTGKEVTDLVNMEQQAGTYKVDWSADGGALNYPSGVYFYSLIIDGITVDTKKMVLIK